MAMEMRQIRTDPTPRKGTTDPPPVGSLLGLEIKRRRPANGGWAVGRPEADRETSRVIADQAPPVSPPSAARQPKDQAPSKAPVPSSPGAGAPPDLPSSLDIFAYWRDRRDGRKFPAWSDFSPDEVLSLWPNSVLLACGDNLCQPRLAASFTEALRAAKRKEAEALRPTVEYTPLLTEWLLSLGREVARLGKPLNDSESLPALKGRVHYRVVGLPLGETPMAVDHVLCHVTRA